MNEEFKQEPSTPQQVDLDVLGVLRRMQQQLGFLEKKIDTLIKQSSEKPSFRDKHFSKSFRPGGFGHSHHHDKGGPREGNFSGERPFNREGNQGGGFGQRKKQFFPRRKDRS